MARTKNYVNNPQFLEELIRYKAKVQDCIDKGLDKPQISKYIGECVMLIAHRLSNLSQFSGYSYKDEMIDDGIEACFKYAINAFNPEKSSNPFAYFTQTIYNAFISRIKLEKLEQYKKLKVLETYCTGNQELSSNFYTNEITQTYIYNMEKTFKKAKAKKPPVALEFFIEEKINECKTVDQLLELYKSDSLIQETMLDKFTKRRQELEVKKDLNNIVNLQPLATNGTTINK